VGLFTEDFKIVIASTTTAGAAGQTAITSSAVDTAGFESCTFIIPVGAITAGAVTTAKVQQCDTSGGSYADLTGTSVTIADDDDDKLKYIEVFRPRERFLKCVVSRATQNATIGGIVAVLKGASTRPVTQGTNVAGEQHISVAEGTA
jgi:hypothetical protein